MISFPSPFCLYLKFRLANSVAWDEFTNPQENRPNKMAKEMHSKQHKFRGSQRFPGLSYILIATAKEKMAMWNVYDITCARDWTQVCYIFSAY